MRLIDADLFKKQMSALALTSPFFFTSKVVKLLEIIDKQPTVDAVPVVRGEWIPVPSSDMSTGKAYECSNCKKMRYGSFMPPFCQMCGADM